MKHKKLLIAGVAVFSVVVFLAVFLVIWYWGDSYPDLNNDFKDSVEIPGLDEGAVPQGMCNYYYSNYTFTDEEGETQTVKQEFLFISAYMKSGPSRIYVTGEKTGYVGYVTLKYHDPDNENADESGYADYYGHAGGIANSCADGKEYGTLWMVSDGTVYCAQSIKSVTGYKNIAEEVISRASMTDGENVIKFQTSFQAYNEASFCFFYENGTSSITSDKLYVGEFYMKGKYPTDESHHITTPSGEEQHAFVYEYTSNTDMKNPYGLELISDPYVPDENYVPEVKTVYSIPDKVQGFALTRSGDLILSQSYGLANSTLQYYDWSQIKSSSSSNYKKYDSVTGNTLEYVGVEKQYNTGSTRYYTGNPNVYFIESTETKLKRTYTLPSMAEGLCTNTYRAGEVEKNTVYVLFESGSYKYKAFVRQVIRNVKTFEPRV